MIVFDTNIFYPQVHKVDHIKLDEHKVIHYQVSSDNQNKRWHIAVTLEDNGKQICKPALAVMRNSYGEIQSYITTLPSIINSSSNEITINNQMKKDLDNIINRLEIEIEMIKDFKMRYNI